jgi:phage terminase Nu1 subunit (DNA packaging protein)
MHLRSLAVGRGGEAVQAGSLLDADAVLKEWSSILSRVRAGVLAAPSRVQQRLPHLTRSDVAEVDAELRAVLAELGEGLN